MYFNGKESGIPLTEDVKALIELAIQHEGRQSKLARACGVGEANISSWLGNVSTRQKRTISWRNGKKIVSAWLKKSLLR